jgi:hypothetical protein
MKGASDKLTMTTEEAAENIRAFNAAQEKLTSGFLATLARACGIRPKKQN